LVLPALAGLALAACEDTGAPIADDWPLACEFASFDLTEDAMAACARRGGDGELQVRPEVLAAIERDPGVQSLRVDGQWLFARNGATAPALPYDNGPDYFREGLARILQDGRVGFVNERLETVVEPVWDFAFPFENGVAVVCTGCRRVADGEHSSIEGGGWGYVDSTGVIVVEPVHLRDALPSPPDNVIQ
jgi:hypothetical protein